MSDKRIFLWRAVYLNFPPPSAPAVPLLVSLFGSMVIFVAFLLEISASFFLFFLFFCERICQPNLTRLWPISDWRTLGSWKKNSQDAKKRLIFMSAHHFSFCWSPWRFVYCKFPELQTSFRLRESARIRKT